MKIKPRFVVGETHTFSEDYFTFSLENGRLTAIVGDFASNIVGGPYIHPEVASLLGVSNETFFNGGIIGATLIKKLAEQTGLTGSKLVDEMNKTLADCYNDLDIAHLVRGNEHTSLHRAHSFTGYFAHVVVNKDVAEITAVGDVRVLADGNLVAGTTKAIDIENARLRAEHYAQHQDLKAASEFIQGEVVQQYARQNVPGHRFSYPAIDGTDTLPKSGIRHITIPTPQRLLMFTDGYVALPQANTIEQLEAHLRDVYTKDPLRVGEFADVKYKKDDRTALEIDLRDDDFDHLIVSN